MFGIGMSKEEKERKAAEQAAARAHVEQRVNAALEALKIASPKEAEKMVQTIRDVLNKSKVLTRDFKKTVMDQLRPLQCAASMRAAQNALETATLHARNDHKPERAKFIGEAREHINKAMSLGAMKGFKEAAEREIRMIMEMGGVSHHGKSTDAKPEDKAPRAPNRAKI